MTELQKYTELLGRVLIALLFLAAGFSKITSFGETQAYMLSAGVPVVLLPVAAAFEVGAALAILFGWRTRFFALALTGFLFLTAIIFHRNFADPVQSAMFLKNLAIAGGLLAIYVLGPGPLSLDKRTPIT